MVEKWEALCDLINNFEVLLQLDCRTISSRPGVNICSVLSDQWDIPKMSQTFVFIPEICVIIISNTEQTAARLLGFVYILFSYYFWHYRHKISWMDWELWSQKPISRHRVILLVCSPAHRPHRVPFSRSTSCTAIKFGHSVLRLKIFCSIDKAVHVSEAWGPGSGTLLTHPWFGTALCTFGAM